MSDGMLWPVFTVVKAGSEMRRYYDERLLRLAVRLLEDARCADVDTETEWARDVDRLLASLPPEMPR